MRVGALDLPIEGAAFNALMIALAVIAIAVAVVAALYQRRSNLPPRRQLTIYTDPPASLLREVSAEIAGLEVFRDGKKVEDPYVVSLTFTGTGTHDITSGQFNDRHPIRIAVGAKILEVLGVSSSPEQATPATIAAHEEELTLDPTLIRRRQEIVIQLLTSGRPRLEHLEQAVKHDLSDVDVQYRKPAAGPRPPLHSLLATLASLLAIVALLASFFLYDRNASPAALVTPDHGSVGSKITIRGERYDKYDVVTIYFAEPSAPGSKAGTVQTDQHGSFQTEVTVPPDLPKGRTQITLSARSSVYVYKDFYVTG